MKLDDPTSRARAAAMLRYAAEIRAIDAEIDQAQLNPLNLQTPGLVYAQDALERARLSEWNDYPVPYVPFIAGDVVASRPSSMLLVRIVAEDTFPAIAALLAERRTA